MSDLNGAMRDLLARCIESHDRFDCRDGDTYYAAARAIADDAVDAMNRHRLSERSGSPTDAENWLIDCLHYSIQFHIWADATRDQVAEVIQHIEEMSCWDDHAGVMVRVRRGVSSGEAQEAVDRILTATPDPRITQLEADRAALRAALEKIDSIATDAPELNMSNFDHDDVSALNAAMVEVFAITRAAIAKATGAA